jgi:glycosyltransferase involved in cell wall biosynthesis
MDEGGAVPVCIDGRMLGPGGTGVSTYARALMAAVPLAGFDPWVLEEVPGWLETRDWPRLARARRWADAARSGVRRAVPSPVLPGTLIAPELFRIAQVHFDMHRRLLPVRTAQPPGIMHWTYPVPLRMEGWINVYTVHDAIPLVAPDLSPIDPRRHARLLDRIVQSADAIATVSESARQEIIGATGCEPGLVVDCGQAALIPPPVPILPEGAVRGRYFLFCGSIEPRKNVERLAAACRASGAGLPLLVTGPDGWRAGEITERIGFDADVRRLPYVDRSTLSALIAGARALLFPSLAEGFGLPVVEAMALGTPVMTSAGGALAETAGGAAMLVDSTDTGAMAAAIARLAADDALCADLRARGRDRAEAFTVPRFAERLGALYAGLIERRTASPYPATIQRR